MRAKNSLWKIDEMADDPVGRQLRDRGFGVPESTAITGIWAARAVAMSASEVSTITAAPSPSARAMVRRNISGSGLATPNVSAPQIAANRFDRPSASSSRIESFSILLVQTASR